MFVALFGSFAGHPWLTGSADAGPGPDYLIRDRTQAMWWSAAVGGGVGLAPSPEGLTTLWDIRDAGPEALGDNGTGEPVAWFHVLARTPAKAPLPVRALLTGCGDAVARLGRLDLDSVQVVLPLDRLDPSTRMALYPQVDGTGWWAARDPEAGAQVTITIDSGQDPSAPAAVRAVVEGLNALDQDVVAAHPDSLGDRHPEPPRLVFSDHLWPGPPAARASFTATLAEWNLDTIGWAASLLADVAAGAGLRTPTALTVRRSAA